MKQSYSAEVEARNADEAQEPLALLPNGRQIAAIQGWLLAKAKLSEITLVGKLLLPQRVRCQPGQHFSVSKMPGREITLCEAAFAKIENGG